MVHRALWNWEETGRQKGSPVYLLGLNSREIARQIRNAYYGSEALRQLRGKNEVKVMVRLPIGERLSEYNLEEMILRTSSGKEIPLRQAVTFSRGRSYTSIERRNPHV